MKKINVVLNYVYNEDGISESDFDDIIGDDIRETIGQESANEIFNRLEEINKEATVQLIEDGKIIKEKKLQIF